MLPHQYRMCSPRYRTSTSRMHHAAYSRQAGEEGKGMWDRAHLGIAAEVAWSEGVGRAEGRARRDGRQGALNPSLLPPSPLRLAAASPPQHPAAQGGGAAGCTPGGVTGRAADRNTTSWVRVTWSADHVAQYLLLIGPVHCPQDHRYIRQPKDISTINNITGVTRLCSVLFNISLKKGGN